MSSCIVTDCVPDNMYTGMIYYESKGSNKWLMMFMMVQNIKVFLEVHNKLIIIQTDDNYQRGKPEANIASNI